MTDPPKYQHRTTHVSSRLSVFAIVLASVTASTRPAGSEDRPLRPNRKSDLVLQFEELRSEFLTDRRSELAPYLPGHIARLAELETLFVAARDYDAAIAASRQRKRYERELRLTRIARGEKNKAVPSAASLEPVKLTAAAARSGGGVRFSGDRSLLTGWDTAGAYAEWNLPSDLAPGGYRVVLHYSGGGSDRGRYTVREAFSTLSRKSPRQSDEGSSSENAEVGTLRLTPGSQRVRLTADSVDRAPLFELAGVTLLPPGSGTGSTGGSDNTKQGGSQ